MEQYITAGNDDQLSPIVVVATMALLALFAVGFAFRLVSLLL